MTHEKVLVIDFGGQYNQLIARRVREHKIYCEVKSYKTPVEEIRAMNPKGIIFTGGPNSVYLDNSPRMDKAIFELACLSSAYATARSFLFTGSAEKSKKPTKQPLRNSAERTACSILNRCCLKA